MTTPFKERLCRYLQEDGRTESPAWRAVRMAELVSGVIAVEDTEGEIDLYFDSRIWEARNPSKWARHALYPRGPARHHLGVLLGLARKPQAVQNMREAMAFARTELMCKVPAIWHATPQLMPVPDPTRAFAA